MDYIKEYLYLSEYFKSKFNDIKDLDFDGTKWQKMIDIIKTKGKAVCFCHTTNECPCVPFINEKECKCNFIRVKGVKK